MSYNYVFFGDFNVCLKIIEKLDIKSSDVLLVSDISLISDLKNVKLVVVGKKHLKEFSKHYPNKGCHVLNTSPTKKELETCNSYLTYARKRSKRVNSTNKRYNR